MTKECPNEELTLSLSGWNFALPSTFVIRISSFAHEPPPLSTRTSFSVTALHHQIVIDLNHILLFIACISPLAMLAQTLRRGGLYRAWRLASFAVLAVTGAAWLGNPNTAGFLGAGAWVGLLLLPAVGICKVLGIASHQRYGAGRRARRPVRFFYSAPGVGVLTGM